MGERQEGKARKKVGGERDREMNKRWDRVEESKEGGREGGRREGA